jgi:hypothetical protein
MAAANSYGGLLFFLGLVDVVADHSTKDTAYNPTDDRAFYFVLARRRSNYRTRNCADLRITLGVLDRYSCRL